MRKSLIAIVISAGALAAAALAQTAPSSSSAPATQSSAEQRMNEMLRPPPGSGKMLQPTLDGPATDKTSGPGSIAVAPNTPVVKLQPDGTHIFDRSGRLTRSADGSQAQFTFASDGKTLNDPPVIILPNKWLVVMEEADRGANRDFLMRVTGMLTEYRGRNYLLVEKVVVPLEINAQF